MDFHLVVLKPFDGFARGDIISETARINEVLKGEHAASVVRVANHGAKDS